MKQTEAVHTRTLGQSQNTEVSVSVVLMDEAPTNGPLGTPPVDHVAGATCIPHLQFFSLFLMWTSRKQQLKWLKKKKDFTSLDIYGVHV